MSELLVINTMDIVHQNPSLIWTGIYFFDGQIYSSQVGLQGILWSIPSALGIIPSNNLFYTLIFLNTLAFNYVFISILFLIKSKYGKYPALFFAIPILFSTFFWLNAGNLYWMHVLYILPFYFTLKYYNRIDFKKYLALIFLLFVFKLSCGFEHITTFLLASVLPIFWAEFETSIFTKRIIHRLFSIANMAVVSFLFVFVLLILRTNQLSNNPDYIALLVKSYFVNTENKPHFLNYLNLINTKHEIYGDLLNSTPDKYSDGFNGWANVLKARETYKGLNSMAEYFSFKGIMAIANTLQFLLAFSILIFLTIKFNNDKLVDAFIISSWLSLLSLLVWIFVMPIHFYLHAIYWRGVSDFIVVFPFFVILSTSFGLFIQRKFKL